MLATGRSSSGIADVPGIRVGHWSDQTAMTGCSVVVMPAGTVASGEVRGGAPGTREWALLDPRRTVGEVNAVVLTGGSAFGLAACDGVVRWCEERGIGFPAPTGPVPIVVGMVLYDLAVGDPGVRPGPEEGYSACVAAGSGATAVVRGRVGAGTGATIAKWRGAGAARPRPAGLGSAGWRDGDLVVGAMFAVNAIGEPRSPGTDGPLIAGNAVLGGSTTIGVVITNAALDKGKCKLAAEASHDGLARALDPVHTGFDGDAIVVAATGEVPASIEAVRALAAWVTEHAVLDACTASSGDET